MEENESSKNRRLLEKYLADSSKKRLAIYKEENSSWYEFEDRILETPDEFRQYSTGFRVYKDGTVPMFHIVKKNQKFLCVNGPLAGQRVTEENAKDYVLFNRSNRDKDAPNAVLVYRPSFS